MRKRKGEIILENKITRRMVSTILLVIFAFNFLISPFSYANEVDSYLNTNKRKTEKVDQNSGISDALEQNPLFNPSTNIKTGEKDKDNPKYSDKKVKNDDIKVNKNNFDKIINNGTAKKHAEDKQRSELNGGTHGFAVVLTTIAKAVELILSSIYLLINLIFWDDMTDFIPVFDEHEGKKLHFFTLENLFYNRVRMLDVNFFNIQNENSINGTIKKNVAFWHSTIRNLTLLFMLIVIAYLAIKLIISSVQDKPGVRAKYKSLLTDLIVSLLLIFFMQFIFAIVLYFCEYLILIFRNLAVKLRDPKILNFEKSILLLRLGDLNDGKPLADMLYEILAFVMLIGLYGKFIFVFVRRFFMLAFLTVISPFISITYAVDKFNDGKTQIFDSTLKEYVSTALLGPVYAGMYFLMSISISNVILKEPFIAVILLFYFGRIEKVIKNMFGLRDLQAVRSSDSYKFNINQLIPKM